MPVEKRERRQPGGHEGREPGLGARLSRFEARLPRLPAGGDVASRQAAELAARMGELTKVIGDLGPLLDELAPGVIGTETLVLDSNGQAVKQFRIPFRSLGVDYFGATTLTVAAAPLASGAPGPGPGIGKIGPGGFAVLNMRAYVASFYGLPGEVLTFTAYAKPQPPNGVVNGPAGVLVTGAGAPMAASLNGYGTVAANVAAGQQIAATPNAPAGLYRVDCYVGLGGTTGAVDANNVQLQIGATVVGVITMNSGSGSIGESFPVTFYVRSPGGQAFGVNAIVLATTTAAYRAQIVATQIAA